MGNGPTDWVDPSGFASFNPYRIVNDITCSVLKFVDGTGAKLNTQVKKANAEIACRADGNDEMSRGAQTMFADEAAEDAEGVLKIYKAAIDRGVRIQLK